MNQRIGFDRYIEMKLSEVFLSQAADFMIDGCTKIVSALGVYTPVEQSILITFINKYKSVEPKYIKYTKLGNNFSQIICQVRGISYAK